MSLGKMWKPTYSGFFSMKRFITFRCFQIQRPQAPGYASLLFDSIRESDEGEYICIATNAEGQKRESVNIDGNFCKNRTLEG